jgi:hypothetical protein
VAIEVIFMEISEKKMNKANKQTFLNGAFAISFKTGTITQTMINVAEDAV